MPRLLLCDCGAWGVCPERMDERKHFGKCPQCRRLMKLLTGITPEEIALPKRDEVSPGIVSQKGAN
jgi:hypothetical protein